MMSKLLVLLFIHASFSIIAAVHNSTNHSTTTPKKPTTTATPTTPIRGHKKFQNVTNSTTATGHHARVTTTAVPGHHSQNQSSLQYPPVPADLGHIPQQDRDFLVRLCSGGKCMGQSAESKALRQEIKDLRIKSIMKVSPFKGNHDLAEKSVEMTMRRVFQAKIATIRRFGIPKGVIEPSDDGLFEGDMLISDQFASLIWKTSMKQELSLRNDSNSSQTDLLMSQPSDHVMDDNWSMPVQYHIDDSISKTDAMIIRQAMSEISKMTLCTELIEKNGSLSESDLAQTIVIQKMQNLSMPTNICSLSTYRRGPVNNVYLNCGCKDLKGNAIHGMMHALGVVHHHNRIDRDKYLSMAWLNIDLKHIDYFTIHDPQIFSTFGTPFDIGSIMNYPPSIASKGLSKVPPSGVVAPTMVVKRDLSNQGSIGQRSGLSCTDAEVVKKSYCCPKDCHDSTVNCGYLATSDYCSNNQYRSWMFNQCPKSCQKCCHLKCSSQCESFCKNAMPK